MKKKVILQNKINKEEIMKKENVDKIKTQEEKNI